MRLRVLGCYGTELADKKTCGFQINESVLLDAGTIASVLDLSEQRRIKQVLLSHAHLDHTKGLASFSENLQGKTKGPPVTLIGLSPVLEALKNHLFNHQLWPDFTQLPNPENPIFRMKTISEGERYSIEALEIWAYAVNHTVPSSGFIIRQNDTSLLYSGDTHQTKTLWEAAAKEPTLKAALIEVSFPNALIDLAKKSKHLTPALLQKEFSKIGHPKLPVYVYHMKPRYLQQIKKELNALGLSNLRLLTDGMTINL